jgi:thiamine-phosphate pyrophosphorylase
MRLIDANANRAREGLRVLEDYARFVLDARDLCEALKTIRHDLAGATRDLATDAIHHRDTPGDVGTAIKTTAELKREDLIEVVTAAGKRLGESLRAIEEYLKTLSPTDAAKVESIRYRFYDVEQRLARTLRPTSLVADVRLYVLITESACRGDWFTAAEAAIRGGADCLQLREKNLEGAELLRRANRFVDLCRRQGVISIINDRPDIALLSNADGVHVGQEDLPAVEVRKLLGRSKIVGVSTHRIEQARQAVLDGADYIGVGPMFRSETKPRDFVAGLEFARQVAGEIRIPAVAIAGITKENVDEVLATGVKAIAVTAAVVGCEDVEGAARRLKEKKGYGCPKTQS